MKNIILEGYYRGYRYMITYKHWYCAYTELHKFHPYYKKYYDDIDIYVHGGITYSGIHENKYYVGWDYAHIGDYTFFSFSENDHKYTIEEIINDCKYAIDQLIEQDNSLIKIYYEEN